MSPHVTSKLTINAVGIVATLHLVHTGMLEG